MFSYLVIYSRLIVNMKVTLIMLHFSGGSATSEAHSEYGKIFDKFRDFELISTLKSGCSNFSKNTLFARSIFSVVGY